MAIRPSKASQTPTTIIMMPANKMAPAAQRLLCLPSAICDSLLWFDASGGPSPSPVWAGSSHQADKVATIFPGEDPDGRGRSGGVAQDGCEVAAAGHVAPADREQARP